MILLQTSKGTSIPNYQGTEISQVHRNWNDELPRKHPRAIFRTLPSPVYNCHGLVFAARRTRIEEPEGISTILREDAYVEVASVRDVKPGDVVVYYSDDNDPNHSGIVVANDEPHINPLICSKWGTAGEVIHYVGEVPDHYGPTKRYFRCRL